MLELYIENQKIDLNNDIEIKFDYETIDPNKLSSIKNSFSKTVNIPGTPNNNKIFGYIFRHDKVLSAESQGKIFNDYDPHKMVNWFINKNGVMVTRGYCTLNNIKVKNDFEYTYQLTLYGGLGEFFYSLTYNEDGTEKTLYDLFWNWRPKTNIDTYDEPTTLENENDTLLYYCEPAIVVSSYSKLNPYYEATGTTDIDKDIVFVPCYTGVYEDFDSKTMLVSTAIGFKEEDEPDYISPLTRVSFYNSFPTTVISNDKVYTTVNRNLEPYTKYDSYGMVKFSRDIDPFEAGELRINELPIAIRLSKLMEVISNPANNGGYVVEWDNDIKLSPYWLYSWIMIGKQHQEKSEHNVIEFVHDTLADTAKITFDPETCDAITTEYYARALYDGDIDQGTYQLVSTYQPSVHFVADYTYQDQQYWKYFMSGAFYTKQFIRPYNRVTYEQEQIWNTNVVITTAHLNNEIQEIFVDVIFYTINSPRVSPQYSANLAQILIPALQNYLDINEPLPSGTHKIDIHNIAIHNITINSASVHEEFGYSIITGKYNQLQMNHQIEISSYGNLKIRQYNVLCWNYIYFNYDVYPEINISEAGIYGWDDRHPSTFDNTKTFWSILNIYNPQISPAWQFPSSEYTSNDYGFSMDFHEYEKNGLYLEKTTGFGPLKLYKNTIFSETESPMNYLSGFCKLMNYRFICDETEKKIYIKTLKNYYQNNIYDLTDKVDLSRDTDIKAVTSQYSNINIGLETPETYPVNIFNRSTKDKFNVKKYNTNIEYPLPDTELLNDLIYKNTIDWQENSIFYNIFPQFPKAYNTTTVSWNLFYIDPDQQHKIDSSQFFMPGAPATLDNLLASPDPFPKNAIFSSENKSVDFGASLLFLNGFVKNYDYVSVEQTVKECTPDNVIRDSSIEVDGSIIEKQGQYIGEYIYDGAAAYFLTVDFSEDKYANDDTYVINFYDINDNFIGGVYTKSSIWRQGGKLRFVQIPNIPSATYKIKCVTRNEDTAPIKIRKDDHLYVISPRIIFTQDNSEQYYLNQKRCYQYDFSYHQKNWYSWGYEPQIIGGSATSWALPMFTKDLYNTYSQTNTYNILKESEIINNSYVSSDGSEFIYDSYYEIYQYNINSESQYKFSGQYHQATGSRIVIAYYDTDDHFISSEYVVNQNDKIFDDVDLHVPTNATKIYVNVQKAFSEYINIKVAATELCWNPSITKVASWNFVQQSGLDNLYNLTNTNFIFNTQFDYNVTTKSMKYINNNEYKLGYFPSDNVQNNTNLSRIYDTNWKDYLDDLYDRNARDVTAYVDLSEFGRANDIMRNIYSWKSNLWIITKIFNFNISDVIHDKMTKVTLHKISDISNWTN